MISILVPTRGRPDNVRNLVSSARCTADTEIEFVFYIDEDDTVSQAAVAELDVSTVVGPRILLSEMWNRCWERARYDVAMHCGDDVVFHTPGWDEHVLSAFSNVPDGIALVWGRDGVEDRPSHGFLHRNWVDAIGYFVPPYFASDYNDTWLAEVAGILNRGVFLPDVYIEHRHFTVGKHPLDTTHRERLARHQVQDCDRIWRETEHMRRQDAAKLQAVIDAHRGALEGAR